VIIATQHPEGEGIRAGEQVIERFFLGGIALEGCDITPGDVKGPLLVEPDLADAPTAIPDEAPMAASVAS
jgi:hypothetical protein